jgi:drug/metabolite transporter (DMT)-like permease
MTSTLKGVIYILSGAVCISFAALFVRWVDAGPTAVAFYRLLWGGLALTLIAVARRDRLLPTAGMLPLMAAAAFFFASDLSCWHQSILYIGPGLATIITNFQVFFLAIIGVLFMRERPGPRLLVSIPLAFLGLWMLLEVDITKLPPETALGLALALCTAAFYTGYILCLRQSQLRSAHLSAAANMAVISLLSMMFSGGIALGQDRKSVV